MQLHQAGEKSKAICDACGDVRSTTFAYRDVPFEDGSGVVKDILASVCDGCGAVVAIPAQSTPAIRRARERAEVSLEVMLPASELELLDLAIFRIDPSAGTTLRKVLLTDYIRRLAAEIRQGRPMRLTSVAATPDRPKAKHQLRKRLSMKLAPRVDDDLNALMTASGLNKTPVVRGVIHMIGNEVVMPPNPRGLDRLREIAAAAA